MSTLANSNHWFVCPRANPEAEIRLFLFPYAGGGPAVFNKWASEFPDKIEIWIAHYPGRGSRHQETPIKEIKILTERFFQAIGALLNKPFAFFGHSLGGLIAFELTRQLRQDNCPSPKMLFVSACGAPHLSDPNPPIQTQPDPEFIKALRELNDIPSELLDQPEIMEIFLPILRADFEAVENYHYDSTMSPLHMPVVALAGLYDPRVSRERVEAWALHTDAGFKPHYFSGDHFFINTCREAVIASITAELIK